jgi:hypothetical protein
VGEEQRSEGTQQRNYVGENMSELRKAAQTALEAWDRSRQWPFPTRPDKEFDALRAALALPERQPLTSGELYTAYITATNQTLRPQDERLAFAFARAIEAAHGIGGKHE